jgi:3-oxoacyl-[acyl-carrier protein] reductase
MKYAIVTGGTIGIGKQITIDLLKKRYFVFTTFIPNDKMVKQAEEDFNHISPNFSLIQSEFADLQQIENMTNFIKSKTNKIDCFIGNAGTTIRKLFTDITDEEWENTLRINLSANFFIVRNLDSIMNEGSNIIFIGSLLGKIPHATSLIYGVSKAALHALALNLVKEYDNRKIRVNAILPGFVETEWQKNKPLEIKNSINEKTALKRFASVIEISQACMFIIDNQFINGSLLEITGAYNYK